MAQNNRISILGIKIDPITIEEAIGRIIARDQTMPPVFVVKPYVEFFTKHHHRTLNRAWLSLPDGVALQWAAYYQSKTKQNFLSLIASLFMIILRPKNIRNPVPDKFAGTNFTWPLLQKAAREGKRVYLVGSPLENDIQHTKDFIQKRLPEIDIVGTLPGKDDSGVFSAQLEKQLIKQINQHRPDIVLIGIGFPRQELLMERILPHITSGVLIGEGGTFDYQQFGGAHRKAPRIMQKSGLEWLWRLALQPSRITRQVAIPRFIWRVYRFTKAGQTQYHKINLKKRKRNN